MEARRDQLRSLYGFDFPDDLLGVFAFAHDLDEEAPLLAFDELLGIELTGPFDVLAGRFDDVSLRYSPLLHQRYTTDLPEFFTVFVSPQTGYRWGYWFDAPGDAEPFVVAHGAVIATGEAIPPSIVGYDLFEALRSQLEWCDEEVEEALLQGSETMESATKEKLETRREELGALRGLLSPHAPGTLTGSAYIQAFSTLTVERGHVVPSHQGIGVAVDEARYEPLDLDGRSLAEMGMEDVPALEKLAFAMLGRDLPGAALLLGRELWGVDALAATSFGLLEQAYDSLSRPVLQQVCEALRTTPLLIDPNLLSYKPGDYLDLTDAFAHPEDVRKLEIGGQWLGVLPDELGALGNLAYLDVWGNQLYDLPATLKDCAALQTLHIHLNVFSEMPSVIGSLPALEVLIAARCSMTTIGDWFGRCTTLKHLDLHQNKLTSSPLSLTPSLFSLEGLEVLSLAENQLTTLPAAAEGLAGLQRFDLQGNALEALPPALLTLSQLMHLDLRENQIEAFPADLSGFGSLRRLLLHGNPISPGERNRIQAALPEVELD